MHLCRVGGILFACMATFLPAMVASALTVGESREDVIAELGTPQSEMKGRGGVLLMYHAGILEFKDGKLQNIPSSFAPKPKLSDVQIAYESAQWAKGLVLFNGQWFPKADLDRMKKEGIAGTEYRRRNSSPLHDESASGPETEQGDITHIDKQGQYFEVRPLIAQGRITLISFYSHDDPASGWMNKWLEQVAKRNSSIALFEVDVVDTKSPLAHSYGIEHFPQVLVYDKETAQVGPASSDMDALQTYINEAARKPAPKPLRPLGL